MIQMIDNPNNPFTQAKESSEQDKQSSYKNYMRESDRVINFKEAYEGIIYALNPASSTQRANLIDCASIMSMELTLSNDYERNKFNDLLTALKQQDRSIEDTVRQMDIGRVSEDNRNLILQPKYRSFKSIGMMFLSHYISTQSRANLQFSTPKGLGEIEKFLKVSEINQRYFPNAYGILISPQMELFCRGLFLRAVNNYDNVIIEDAKRGRGKSVLAMTIAITLAGMFGMSWDLERYVLFGESRDYCKKLISEAPRFTPIVFDQAGNQLSSKTSMERDQVDLTNAQDLNRFNGLTTIYNWHDLSMVDKDIRERIATHYITLETRGIANVKSFNLNPHNRGITSTMKERSAVILTPEHAQQITEREATTLFSIPYLPFEEHNTSIAFELWQRYDKRKKDAQILMAQKVKRRKSI